MRQFAGVSFNHPGIERSAMAEIEAFCPLGQQKFQRTGDLKWVFFKGRRLGPTLQRDSPRKNAGRRQIPREDGTIVTSAVPSFP